jgi:NitT/TauT family transport system substrate-binding protein
MRLSKFLLAGAVAALSVVSGSAWSADPVKIRVAWIAPISNWGAMILEKKELARHLGKSYQYEPVHYAGTPQMITALANNELEVANLAFSTLQIAIENAKIDDLRVIADEIQDGVPNYYSQEYMVLKNGPIKKVEDLKGKVVAINAAGSAVDVATRTMLRKHGLENKRDYVMIEAPLPTMRAVLSEKKADLVPTVPPFAFDPALRAVAHSLFTNKDVAGVMQLLMWCARGSFIEKNRAAMVDFMEDAIRITTWYLDPKNHAEVAAISSKLTKQPPERFGWAYTNQDYHHAPGMKPDLEALQRNVAMIKDLGIVNTVMDVKKHADLSLIEEASKRLK